MHSFAIRKQTTTTEYDAQVTLMDQGVVIVLGGGQTHIGAIVWAEPRKSLRNQGGMSATSSVINRLGHLDEFPLRKNAEMLAIALNQPVVVTGGVHIDGLSAEGIEAVLNDCREFFEEMLATIIKEKKFDIVQE